VKRLFWLGIGVAVGVVVVRQIGKAAQAYSPSGLAGTARNSAAGLLGSVRDFVADVRDGMAEREAEIAAAFEQGISLDDLDNEEFDDDGSGGVTRGGYPRDRRLGIDARD
jgi:hypothetical protein